MRKKISHLAMMAILLAGCSKKYTVKDFEWLEGNWKGQDSSYCFFETWKMTGENSMTGFGGAYQEWDTVFRETIKIENIEGSLFYIATVPENNGPVLFKLTSYENSEALFENPEHDFPRKIIYRKQLNGMLHVTLEGTKDNQKGQEELTFMKVK